MMARDRIGGAAADLEHISLEAEASRKNHQVPQARGGADLGEALAALLGLSVALTRSAPGTEIERSVSQSRLAN
jgi:hypothetical protein